MTRALYFIGCAGAGKTTLLSRHTQDFTAAPAIRLHNQLWAEPLSKPGVSAVRLGKPRLAFAGTDALGMAVNPDAITWARDFNLPDYVFGEGQRLSNLAFLQALHLKTDLLVVHLINNNSSFLRSKRAQHLGVREQSPIYVKATQTKSVNLEKALRAAQIEVAVLDITDFTVDESAAILAGIAVC